MKIEIIKEKIDTKRLSELAQENYGEMIKGVVDL